MIRRPPRSTRCPYTTLFRSAREPALGEVPERLETALDPERLAEEPAEQDAAEHVEPRLGRRALAAPRLEEHTSELQSRQYLVCRLLLEKKKPPSSAVPSYDS